jgi:hypothetical protein
VYPALPFFEQRGRFILGDRHDLEYVTSCEWAGQSESFHISTCSLASVGRIDKPFGNSPLAGKCSRSLSAKAFLRVTKIPRHSQVALLQLSSSTQ